MLLVRGGRSWPPFPLHSRAASRQPLRISRQCTPTLRGRMRMLWPQVQARDSTLTLGCWWDKACVKLATGACVKCQTASDGLYSVTVARLWIRVRVHRAVCLSCGRTVWWNCWRFLGIHTYMSVQLQHNLWRYVCVSSVAVLYVWRRLTNLNFLDYKIEYCGNALFSKVHALP